MARFKTAPNGVSQDVWDKFLLYHEKNPAVWEEFERLTLKAIERGLDQWGAKGIFEVIRWRSEIERGEDFKINNNYAPYYARVFQLKYPNKAHFFETRQVGGEL